MSFFKNIVAIILLSLCCALVCSLAFGETYAAENLAFDKYVVTGSDGITFNYVIPNQTHTERHEIHLNPIYWLNEFNLWLGGHLPNNVLPVDLPNDTSLNPTFWNCVGDYNPVADYKVNLSKTVNKTVNNSTITKLDYGTCSAYTNLVSGSDGATNTMFIYNTENNTNEYELTLNRQFENFNNTMISKILD